MKIKIKPFLYSLIRQNFIYIISFIFLLILTIIVLFIGVLKLVKAHSTISKLSLEINQLKKQVEPYTYDDQTKSIIENDLKFLNTLIPNVEDYFSIIYSLERLSDKTGFLIISYNVDLKTSTKDKIKLSVSGVGDSNTFLNFLKNYNFDGGRLITSDKIEYDISKSDITKLNLNFYTSNSNKSLDLNDQSDQIINIDKLLKEIEKIKEKISFDFISQDVEENKFDYPKKSNPFQ
ncbi:MAG: hypothetical protein KatS3mg092_0852 [Patescibacteria group bacterium]|nr:MAG: hypothetical protein KatS3mg092_0852 [Patescibacteria group bacterium]